MKQIKLTKDECAIVDDEDYPYLSNFKWHLSNDKSGYRYAGTGLYLENQTITVPMHYFLTKRTLGKCVVFKNKNSLDNRKENLIICSVSESKHQNRKYKMRSDNRTGLSSKHKGLTWNKKNKKWQVSIMKGRKRYYIGLFSDEVNGARAFNKRARELYGKYAYQNKV